MVIFSGFLAFKLIDIQLFKGDQYRQKAQKMVFKTEIVPASRGSLYDANHNLLAISVTKYDIRMDTKVPKPALFDKEVKALAKELSNEFGKPTSHYLSKLRVARRKQNRYLLLCKNIDYDTYKRVKQFSILKKGAFRGGLIVEQRTVREYPMGQIAKRTVGYERQDTLGNFKGVGLESAYGTYLRGHHGKRLVQSIGKGKWKPVRSNNEIEPKDGFDLVSTIDVNMQDVAHHALMRQLKKFDAHHGCAIVMEVETGEVKAIANLTKQKSGRYLEDYNYAVGESHEPGSTFKLLSTLALLENKKADTTTVVDTEKGRVKFYDRVVPDSHRGGYGKISLAKAFEVSSNTAYAKLINEAFKKDPKDLLDYYDDIKLNEKLGVSISGERAPILPRPGSKQWYGTTLPWMAFGYGVSMTPLQTLAYYNAVANKGVLVKPQFIKEVQNWSTVEQELGEKETIVKICSEDNANKLKELMSKTVERGTAENIYSKQLSMAGKTGTCQKYYYVKGKPLQYIASFAGFFPVENPKYSCVVVVHEPNKKKGYYGSTVAAPVFREIASKIHVSNHQAKQIQLTNSKYIGLPQYEKYEQFTEKYKTIMPNVKGMELMDILPLLENLGLKVKISGNGRAVNQSISPGEKIGNRTQVIVELS